VGRPHHPKVVKRTDGRWMVDCPECMRPGSEESRPIGIGMPLETEATARLLQENHAGSARRRRSGQFSTHRPLPEGRSSAGAEWMPSMH
jgi:hypothetical protein